MYAKVFRALWDGSLCGQSDAQLVFIYLLAHSDADGCVCQPSVAIAAKTGLSVESVASAIALLESADPASGTDTEEGRRLLRTIPARDEWMIVNHSKYRGMRDENERRRQNREAQARFKVSHGKPRVSHGKPRSAAESLSQKSEVRSQKSEDRNLEHLSPAGDAPASVNSSKPRTNPRPEKEPDGFAEFYAAYPRHDGRRAAALEFKRALKRQPTYTTDNLREGAAMFAAQVESEGRDKQFIPMPKVWLHQDRFREFFDEDDDAESEIIQDCP